MINTLVALVGTADDIRESGAATIEVRAAEILAVFDILRPLSDKTGRFPEFYYLSL